jgi:hypothetical protein
LWRRGPRVGSSSSSCVSVVPAQCKERRDDGLAVGVYGMPWQWLHPCSVQTLPRGGVKLISTTFCPEGQRRKKSLDWWTHPSVCLHAHMSACAFIPSVPTRCRQESLAACTAVGLPVLRSSLQVPDATVWYGPDTYMGANLSQLLHWLASMPDDEVRGGNSGICMQWLVSLPVHRTPSITYQTATNVALASSHMET